MDWLAIKLQMTQVAALERDALHIYAAVFIQSAVALMLRRPLSNPLPWLAVLIAEIVNEWADLSFELWPGGDRDRQWTESAHDLVNTMLLPTALLIALRYAPALFDGGHDRGSS